MRTKLVGLAVAGAVGLTGLAAVTVGAPALAAATGSSSATGAVAERVAHIRDALKSLVDDGTLTSSQADKVAGKLAETLPGPGPGSRHRGMGRGLGGPAGLTTAAATLGMTEGQLRAALSDGKTSLADVAKKQGVAESKLVDALVAGARKHLAQEVTEGDLTQAQADAEAKQLSARVTAMVEAVPPVPRLMHRGHGEWPGPAGTTPSSTRGA